jgi:hypothetical protein
MASITFQSRSFGRDPMEAYAAKQANEHRQVAEPRRRDVQNSPLPEYPRRWAEPEVRRTVKSFGEFLAEETAPKPRSAAWKALEELFA